MNLKDNNNTRIKCVIEYLENIWKAAHKHKFNLMAPKIFWQPQVPELLLSTSRPPAALESFKTDLQNHTYHSQSLRYLFFISLVLQYTYDTCKKFIDMAVYKFKVNFSI